MAPSLGPALAATGMRRGTSTIDGRTLRLAGFACLIPARVLLLKPLSAVVSIGSGGPFGAEGPIIATGGALGSLVGQFARITAEERKTLLAAGAAAGMAATFGSPVAAVLLAIELLLFEYRTRSLVPVALAAATAAGVRVAFIGTAPAFDVGELVQPPAAALFAYVVIGAVIGLLAVGVTKAVYAVGIDPRLGALVGMAAMFSGASRALLASVVFAFETTRQSVGLLPLLGGCAAA